MFHPVQLRAVGMLLGLLINAANIYLMHSILHTERTAIEVKSTRSTKQMPAHVPAFGPHAL